MEKERTLKSRRIDSYVPNRGQLPFHQSQAKIRLCVGGNQSGKTTSSCIEAIWHALGVHPYRKVKVPSRGRIVASLGFEEGAHQVIIPKLMEWMPEGMVTRTKNNSMGIPAHWELANGSVLNILSGEQDDSVFEGWSGDWCLKGDHRVLMAAGEWKDLKDIKVGDRVVSFYNNLGLRRTNLVSKIFKRKSKVVRVECKRGLDFVCTPNHKFHVSGKGWTKAKDLKDGDFLVSPPDEFGSFHIPLDTAALLGLMIGDGSLRKNNLIFWCFHPDVLDFANQNLGGIYFKKGAKKGCYRLKNAREFQNFLLEIGLLNKICHEKFVPDIIFKSGKEVVSAFLKGLFSTDGWISEKTVGYASTSKRLVYDIQKLLWKYDIRSTVYYRPSKVKAWKDQWHLTLNKARHVLKFLDEIGIVGDVSLLKTECERRVISRRVWEYKGEGKCREKNEKRVDRLVKVIDVIDLDKEETVYDITVERDHNFICDGVVSSNCWIDEPCRQEIYQASRRGLMKSNGSLWFGLTPLSEPWLYNDIWLPSISHERPEIECFTLDIYDNCIDNGGYLSREAIEAFEKDLTEDVRETRMHGTFRHLSGRVYPMFDPKVHVIESYDVPRDWPVWDGIDPHLRKEHAYCQWAITPDNDFVVCDEIYKKCTIPELAEGILEKRKGKRIVNSLIDTSAETPDSIYRMTPRRMLEEKGIRTRLAQKKNQIEAGIHIMKYLLTPVENQMGEKKPRFFIMKHCRRHITEFLNYVQDDRDTEYLTKDKPRKIYDDMMDLDRYFVVENAKHDASIRPAKYSDFKYGR